MSYRRLGFGVLVTTLLWTAWPSSGSVYVSTAFGNNPRILVFGNGANGNTAPVRTIEGFATDLERPRQMFADVVNGELYVANNQGNTVTVYPLQGNGNFSPIRKLSGAATLLDEPSGVAVDLVHDELVVVNFADGEGSISVYPRTANGNVAPVRRVAGAATGLAFATNVALDPVSNAIFVTTQGSSAGVRVFQRTANGNVAPSRAITGEATQFDSVYGIAIDAPRQQIVVTDREGGAISVFPRGANGNVAPLRRIAGAASGLNETLGVALLGASEIVVANGGMGGGNFSDDAVLVFPRDGNGDLAPLRQINGPAALAANANGVASVQPRLALRDGRFGVQAVFRTQGGAVGDGIPVQLTSDTGYLWFFQAPNVEIVVKVLNGCGINGRYWVFAGGLTDTQVDLIVTDHATGVVRSYVNPQKTAFQPIQDTDAFATCTLASAGGRTVAEGRGPSALASRATGAAAFGLVDALDSADDDGRFVTDFGVSGDTLLLNGERFAVTARWETDKGATGVGHPVAITGDTGYFWFFQAENVEVVVKVLNGCGFNSRYWVFAGGLTDVEVELEVEDTLAGTSTKVYTNPQKTPFQPIQDTSAFATCP